MIVHFFVKCVPPTTTHHSKKIVRAGGFSKLADTPELTKARQFLWSLFAPFAPTTVITGPVRLTLELTYPWLKSESLKARAKGKRYKITKPDCSNAAKTIEDVLVSLRFIEDDNSVGELVVRKFHGDEAGILVRIDSLVEG